MATCLIAKKSAEQLETIVFDGEGGDAVAIFTDPKNAQQYIDEANWNDDFTVASLEAIDFLEWLIQCHRKGIRLMATNPARADQEAGRRVSTMDIEAHLEHAARHITFVASPDF